MPDAAPLYPPLPYHYVGYVRLSVFCVGDNPTLQTLLPPMLTPRGNVFEVFFMDCPDVEGLRPYGEAGVVIPCTYEGLAGAHVSHEYVTTDDALCVGREIWGYPKKLADVTTDLGGEPARATCTRNGVTLLDATFHPRPVDIDRPDLYPRLQVRRLPEADGSRRDQLIRNNLGAAVTHAEDLGVADLRFGGELALLADCDVLGAARSRGDFTLDYGHVLEDVTGR